MSVVNFRRVICYTVSALPVEPFHSSSWAWPGAARRQGRLGRALVATCPYTPFVKQHPAGRYGGKRAAPLIETTSQKFTATIICCFVSAKCGYTENPPENAIFPPAALRVSAMAFSYTENSSFPYTDKRGGHMMAGPEA